MPLTEHRQCLYLAAMSPQEAVQDAVAAAGSQEALARLLSVAQATVSEWATGRRPVPDDRCHEIERAVGGKTTCELLRPDVKWLRIKDKQWLWHPQGRPVIDVARVEAA
jgi:DNA-binding transcriptional regulator YdaS (Cro superfamily)